MKPLCVISSLRRYAVFERLPTHKVLGTYVISALWHGLWPGYAILLSLVWNEMAALSLRHLCDDRYYLFFLTIPAFQALERSFAEIIYPRVRACGPLALKAYGWAEIAGTSIAISYAGLAFHAMSEFCTL